MFAWPLKAWLQEGAAVPFSLQRASLPSVGHGVLLRMCMNSGTPAKVSSQTLSRALPRAFRTLHRADVVCSPHPLSS
jgi:hypothetical protein